MIDLKLADLLDAHEDEQDAAALSARLSADELNRAKVLGSGKNGASKETKGRSRPPSGAPKRRD